MLVEWLVFVLVEWCLMLDEMWVIWMVFGLVEWLDGLELKLD